LLRSDVIAVLDSDVGDQHAHYDLDKFSEFR